MVATVAQLYKAQDLLWAWTGRNIRARYQQSALGWLWAVIQPTAQVAILSLIFTYFVNLATDGAPYPLFSYVAVVPWALLATALPDMAQSLVNNMALVTKIYFPREILPISALLARLMDFLISAALIIPLLLYYGVGVSWTSLAWLPLVLAIQLALILGLGFACAALNVFYRDVQSLLTLVIQLWFYASPIIYPISQVPESWRTLYFLNPMAGVLQAFRAILINQQPPGSYLIASASVSILIFVAGYWLFKRVEFQFADIV